MLFWNINNKKNLHLTFFPTNTSLPSDSSSKGFPVFCGKIWITFSSGFSYSNISFNKPGVYTLARDPSCMMVQLYISSWNKHLHLVSSIALQIPLAGVSLPNTDTGFLVWEEFSHQPWTYPIRITLVRLLELCQKPAQEI